MDNYPKINFEKLLMTFIGFHILLGVFFSFVHEGFYTENYVREDGFIEWLQFDILLALFCIYAWRLKREWGDRLWIGRLCLFTFCALFLFGAGEEISWGQRIFHFKTTEYFAQNNSQGEMNLHNLVIGDFRVNKMIFGQLLGYGMAFYLLFLPPLAKKFSKLGKLIQTTGIPLAQGKHIIGFVIVFLLAEIMPSQKKGEILELGTLSLFLLISLYPKNHEILKP